MAAPRDVMGIKIASDDDVRKRRKEAVIFYLLMQLASAMEIFLYAAYSLIFFWIYSSEQLESVARCSPLQLA